MDPGDPTSMIIAKIRTLEPENASKIIGYFLSQDIDKCELIRIAFGPNILIQSLCQKAKSKLGLPSEGFSSNPSSRTINIHHQSLSPSSPRNRFLDFSRNPNNPLSPSLIRDYPNSNFSPFYDGSSQQQLQLSNHFANLHKRSFSANDACLDSEEFGYRFLPGGLVDGFGSLAAPFMANFGSPMPNRQGSGKFGVEGGYYNSPGRHERKDSVSKQIFLKFPPKSSLTSEDVLTYFSNFGEVEDVNIPHQKTFEFVTFADAEALRTILAQGNSHVIGDSRVYVRGCKDKRKILREEGSEQFAEEGGHLYSPSRHEREDSVSKKIYLTFPSKSSFTTEDVSTYFSNFGPVEDVKIPYQQHRMYGFVTFAKAETVRTILAQGEPHFIGDARVFAKPFKEKEKILQEKQQQQLHQLWERGIYSPSSSPYGMDSRGPRMSSNKTQEMPRRKTEQADLQQAMEAELQRRRLLDLQLPDMEEKSIHHHQRSLFIGFPTQFSSRVNHSRLLQSGNKDEIMEGDSDKGEKRLQKVVISKEERGYSNDIYKGQETGREITLPDSLFGGETRQTESDTEQNKEASSDQSA